MAALQPCGLAALQPCDSAGCRGAALPRCHGAAVQRCRGAADITERMMIFQSFESGRQPMPWWSLPMAYSPGAKRSFVQCRA